MSSRQADSSVPDNPPEMPECTQDGEDNTLKGLVQEGEQLAADTSAADMITDSFGRLQTVVQYVPRAVLAKSNKK
jgi:hypothetical protein